MQGQNNWSEKKSCRRNLCQGFTYIGLLILIAIIGIASAATLQVGSILQRRAAEESLLNIGAEFQKALISYANATPAGQQRFPRTLQDLVRDPRFPKVRRHLRRIYPDPITGNNTWGMVYANGNGGLVGIYSLSTLPPIKIGNFDAAFLRFNGKTSYQEWIFINPSLKLSPDFKPGDQIRQ